MTANIQVFQDYANNMVFSLHERRSKEQFKKKGANARVVGP